MMECDGEGKVVDVESLRESIDMLYHHMILQESKRRLERYKESVMQARGFISFDVSVYIEDITSKIHKIEEDMLRNS